MPKFVATAGATSAKSILMDRHIAGIQLNERWVSRFTNKIMGHLILQKDSSADSSTAHPRERAKRVDSIKIPPDLLRQMSRYLVIWRCDIWRVR